MTKYSEQNIMIYTDKVINALQEIKTRRVTLYLILNSLLDQ